MKVVIAYDGSDCAKAAVDDLRRSGMPRHADALVISVGETLLPPPETLVATPSSAALLESGASRRVASTLMQARAQASHAINEAVAHWHWQEPNGCRRAFQIGRFRAGDLWGRRLQR